MSRRAKIILTAAFVFFAALIIFKPLYDQRQVPLHKRISNYEKALDEAIQAGKPVFLEFYAEY
ncbi:hypothetical protein [Calderihabitans maritimus]|uniref:Uncharacterized protein n=1 Tax=Calderihabitans maritimus TaxID=1246530 RepID=A0A1Z5HSD2_9FIRM|nr:hypothetical protein [Calderihabitans maritimus]GAW92190.1 hypothetical protein KKC1_13490 [Calderihabitans maritimus]